MATTSGSAEQLHPSQENGQDDGHKIPDADIVSLSGQRGLGRGGLIECLRVVMEEPGPRLLRGDADGRAQGRKDAGGPHSDGRQAKRREKRRQEVQDRALCG
jgi:hypothetical protein